MSEKATPLAFSNPKTAEQYETDRTEDCQILVQGLFIGRLSAISPEAAEKHLSMGGTEFRRKPAAKAPTAKAS